MRLQFPITLEPDDNDTFLVDCAALPEVKTFGANRAEAIAQAELAIEEAIAARIADWDELPAVGLSIPKSSGDAIITLSLQSSLKALLFVACKSRNVTRADLMRRLGWHREQVDRLFRLDHASRIDQIDAAFAAIGARVDIDIAPAA